MTSTLLNVVHNRLSDRLGTKFQKLGWSTLSIFKTMEARKKKIKKEKVVQLCGDKIYFSKKKPAH